MKTTKLLMWNRLTEDWDSRSTDSDKLLAADSFRVSDNQVAGWQLHWNRFGTWANQLGFSRDEISKFRQSVVSQIPREGNWFPRLEVASLEGILRLQLRLREAPPARQSLRVWICPDNDDRLLPRRKGPDIEYCDKLREEAQKQGCEEALLRRDQSMLEGAYSALLWWEDDTMFAVSSRENILPSVTRKLLLKLAETNSNAVKQRTPKLSDLENKEVWLVNACHGIQRVTEFVGEETVPVSDSGKATIWQAHLDAAKVDIPS